MKQKQKEPKWKKAQNKKLASEKRSQWLIGVGFLFFLGLLIVGGVLYKEAKKSIWDGKSRLGMVKQDEVSILIDVLLPDQDKIMQIKIPFDLLVEVPFGYGEYQFEKIYRLGKLDNHGGELLTRSAQDLMGISIKGYQYQNQTNLTWWDKLRVRWFNFTTNKKIKLSLIEEVGLSETILPDGSRTLSSNQIMTDELVNQYLFDEKIVNEGLSIAVLNASGVANLATKAARIINNLGGEVSMVSNQDQSDQSQLLVRDKSLLNSETINKLKDVFEIQVIKVASVEEYRADLVLVISEDYSQLR
jgi:LytR cell envelope-related transcriptional attenuator